MHVLQTFVAVPAASGRALLWSGHGDRVGCSDHDGRRARAPRRRLPPGRAGAASGAPHLRPVRQGPGVPGGLRRPMAAHGCRAPRRRARVQQPLPELGNRGPGEVGAGRLRVRAGGLPGRGPLPRVPRSVLPAGDPRPVRVRRVGRGPAVEQRQGRHQRHLVLRDERVARRRAAAAAPGRDLRLGGRRGPLPRRHPPRRHPVHILPPLVRQAGHRGPARDWRPAQRGHRGAGGRTGNPHHRRAGGRAGAVWRTVRRAPAGRRVLPRPVRALGPDHRAAADRRPTGAARACTPGATSRDSPAPPRRASGWRSTASSTGRTSTPTTASACRNGSSPAFCRGTTPGGGISPRSSYRSAPSTVSFSEPNDSGRWPEPDGPSCICGRTGAT